jgi:hypothetical protein
LKEEVRSDAIDRQVADLVDNQQPRHGVDLEPLVEPVSLTARLRAAIMLAAVVKSTR